jgi:hypothetical protein
MRRNISRRRFVKAGVGGVSAALLSGCTTTYTVTTGSVANGSLADVNIGGTSIEGIDSGKTSDAGPSVDGSAFDTQYTAKSFQGSGQVIDNPEVLLFRQMPVVGSKGIIVLCDDGRTGIAVLNDTGEYLYEARVVPADASYTPFATSSAGWEFLGCRS